MISRNEVKERLRDYYFMSIQGDRFPDPESAHMLADELLLEIIDDPEVTDLYRAIRRLHG